MRKDKPKLLVGKHPRRHGDATVDLADDEAVARALAALAALAAARALPTQEGCATTTRPTDSNRKGTP